MTVEKLDPKRFNAFATAMDSGVQWADYDGDRVIEEGELHSFNGFASKHANWDSLNDAGRYQLLLAGSREVTAKMAWAKKMGFGPELTDALEDIQSFFKNQSAVVRFSMDRAEEVVLQTTYNEIVLIVDANKAGTKGRQSAFKKAQLGFLFMSGVLLIEFNGPRVDIGFDLEKAKSAFENMRQTLGQALKTGDAAAIRAFLNFGKTHAEGGAVPNVWNSKIVAKLNEKPKPGTTQGPVIFIVGNRPKQTEDKPDFVKREQPQRSHKLDEETAKGCGCSIGGRP